MRRIRENNGLNNALNPSWVIGEELNGRIEQDANTRGNHRDRYRDPLREIIMDLF